MKKILLAAAIAAFCALSVSLPTQPALAGCPSYDPNCQQPRP